MKNTQSALNSVLAAAVLALGYEYIGHQYFPRGREGVLRVYIDSNQGVTVDDCSKVSRHINAVLNVENPLHGDYTLEVSSPGLDRPLFTPEQFQQFVGKQIRVRLHAPAHDRRNFAGVLLAVEGEQIKLKVEAEEILLPFADIEKANLVAEL